MPDTHQDRGLTIRLHDPTYSQLPPDYSIEEVEEVFRFNGAENEKKQRKKAEGKKESEDETYD